MRRKNEMCARVLSAIMTAIMVVGICPSAIFAVSGETVAKDGTYQKTVTVVNDSEFVGMWDDYDLNVSLTVTEGKISAITAEPEENFDSSNQSFVNSAITGYKGIQTKLVGLDATENTVLAWDAVSGATCTSNAVKSAVLSMMQEAEEASTEDSNTEDSDTEDSDTEETNTGEIDSEVDEQQETSGTVSIAGVSYDWVSEEEEGYTQIADSGIYYAVSEENVALTGTLYGTATLSFTDFYAGDTSKESYDTISSATTSKYTLFVNEDISEVTDSGYEIYGVKNVNVAVDAKTYVEAQILLAANALPEAGVYTKAAAITLNEEAVTEPAQYKTLLADGSYSTTKTNVVATIADAVATLNTSSNWGDYEIDIEETTTSYIRNGRSDEGFAVNSNIQGIILETTDGTKIGMRYLDEIWVQPYEVAFSKESGLVGKTVNKITFLMPDEMYVYEFKDGVYVKEQLPENVSVTAEFKDENTVAVSGLENFTNPKVFVYYVEGSGKNKVTTYYVQDATAKDGIITLDETAVAGLTYTVKVTSDDYVDTTVSAELAVTETEDNDGTESGNDAETGDDSESEGGVEAGGDSESGDSVETGDDSESGDSVETGDDSESKDASDTESGRGDDDSSSTGSDIEKDPVDTDSSTTDSSTTDSTSSDTATDKSSTTTATDTTSTTQETTYQSAEGYSMRTLTQDSVVIDGLASLLPEGTQMSVSRLTSGTTMERAATAINDILQENCNYAVYEIDLSSAAGTEIHELSGYVSVTMDVPAGLVVGNGNTIVVYRLNDDGTLTKCTTTISNGKITFMTNHFSTFIFAEEPLESTTVGTFDENGNQIYLFGFVLLLGMGILYFGYKRRSVIR